MNKYDFNITNKEDIKRILYSNPNKEFLNKCKEISKSFNKDKKKWKVEIIAPNHEDYLEENCLKYAYDFTLNLIKDKEENIKRDIKTKNTFEIETDKSIYVFNKEIPSVNTYGKTLREQYNEGFR